MKNWTTWIEIPAVDLERAKNFYESILKIKITLSDFGDFRMGIFPHSDVGMALVQLQQHYTPSMDGLLVYINCNPDLKLALDRVESFGGKVLKPKSMISEEHGFMALIQDSEGNRVALHSDS